MCSAGLPTWHRRSAPVAACYLLTQHGTFAVPSHRLQSTGFGGYGTEDESTPARRRYQQQAAVAAAAAAAAAKEQGGVQRSIKFPPLGPQGPCASGGGLARGYGSSSQVGWHSAGGHVVGGWL